jgi:peptidyl-tRNA hydrolase
MANIGQTVIIRTDIFEVPADMGLMSAQVAHIHFEHARKLMTGTALDKDFQDMMPWLRDPYLFVKKVPNLEGLHYFLNLATEADLPCSSWKDTVYVRLSPTMKKAFPDTLVGISIGPDDADKIRTVVGDLPLL